MLIDDKNGTYPCNFWLSVSVCCLCLFSSLSASSIGGSPSFFAYSTEHQIFHDADTAQGFIRFSNGFSIIGPERGVGIFKGATATLDGYLTVSGGIDLRETGTLSLLGTLTLEPSVTFSSSGYIKGAGMGQVLMRGDITIPDNTVLHIQNSLLWDGNGCLLTIGAHSKIILDMDTTLTLRNIIIKTNHNQPSEPAFICTSTTDKLIWENVTLATTDDFYFDRGQLFVCGDVMITGSARFIYRSTSPLYIKKNSSLIFSSGSTFDFRPSTTGNQNFLAKDGLVMTDQTSQLILNGCTLQTSYTGLRLTNGTVIFDNNTTVSTGQLAIRPGDVTLLQSLGSFTSWPTYSPIMDLQWSPNGRYLAVGGHATGDNLVIYQLVSNNTMQTTPVASVSIDTVVVGLNWHPDGRYLAVGTSDGGPTINIIIYRFNGSSLIQVASADIGTELPGLAWSPDGRFLVGCPSQDSSTFIIYEFTGTSLVPVITQPLSGVVCAAWSPDGRFLAIGGGDGSASYLYLYRFNVTSLTLLSISTPTPVTVDSIAWSPDGAYVVTTGNSAFNNYLDLYSFSGLSLGLIIEKNMGGASYDEIRWGKDGRYIFWAGNAVNNSPIILDGPNALNTITAVNVGANFAIKISDHPFLPLFATALNGDTQFRLYQIGYRYDSNKQAKLNGLVFGNSTLGSAYDPFVILNGGAQIDNNGVMAVDIITN